MAGLSNCSTQAGESSVTAQISGERAVRVVIKAFPNGKLSLLSPIAVVKTRVAVSPRPSMGCRSRRPAQVWGDSLRKVI